MLERRPVHDHEPRYPARSLLGDAARLGLLGALLLGGCGTEAKPETPHVTGIEKAPEQPVPKQETPTPTPAKKPGRPAAPTVHECGGLKAPEPVKPKTPQPPGGIRAPEKD